MNFDQFLDQLHIDKELVRSRFNNMDNVLERFLLRFPQDHSIHIMEQALLEGNAEEFERASHTLKGLAANLGLDDLSRLAAECVSHVRVQTFDPEKAKQLYVSTLEEYNRIVRLISVYRCIR